jgi:hypothetical protein
MQSDENNFISEIDCNFPYADKEKCLNLINRASSISANAIFFIIQELSQPTYIQRRENLAAQVFIDLLNFTSNKFNHPLKDIIVDTAYKMIHDQYIGLEEAIIRMNEVKKYPGQLSALNTVYSSWNWEELEEEQIEVVYNNILVEWSKYGA